MPRSPVARASRLLLGALLLGALVIAHAPRVEGGDAASAVQHGGGPVGGVRRKRLGLDDFYQRCLDLDGLPILSSQRPPDVALREAAWVIAHMLRGPPDVLRTLAERGIRVAPS